MIRIGAPAAACLAALLMAGCSSAYPKPPGPTADDVEEYVQTMLDATWRGSGLDDSYERPQEAHGEVVDYDDWDVVMRGCMSTEGYSDRTFSWGTGQGYFLSDESGASVDDPDQQFVFYRCAIRNPLDPVSSGDVLSDAQVKYRFDFFARWTIPCLAAQGITVDEIPDPEIYLGNPEYTHWSPLWSIPFATQEEYDQIVTTCGPPEPLL